MEAIKKLNEEFTNLELKEIVKFVLEKDESIKEASNNKLDKKSRVNLIVYNILQE